MDRQRMAIHTALFMFIAIPADNCLWSGWYKPAAGEKEMKHSGYLHV